MVLPSKGGWWLLTALAAMDAADGLIEGTQILLKVVTHVSAVLSNLHANVAGAQPPRLAADAPRGSTPVSHVL